MPPSQLSIATSVLSRLLKEEASYHKELAQQKTRIAKLEATQPEADSNEAYSLKQEVCYSVFVSLPIITLRRSLSLSLLPILVFLSTSPSSHNSWTLPLAYFVYLLYSTIKANHVLRPQLTQFLPPHAHAAGDTITQQKALEETKAVFPQIRERIANAREKLQGLLVSRTEERKISVSCALSLCFIEEVIRGWIIAFQVAAIRWFVRFVCVFRFSASLRLRMLEQRSDRDVIDSQNKQVSSSTCIGKSG